MREIDISGKFSSLPVKDEAFGRGEIAPKKEEKPASPSDKVEISKSALKKSRKYLPGASEFGVSEAVWQKTTQNEKLKKGLQSLSPEVVRGYKTTPPKNKIRLRDEINQEIAIGPFTVKVREAYIKGSMFGFNVFDIAEDELAKRYYNGEITGEEYASSLRFIEFSRKMTKEQREAIVVLLENEVKSYPPQRE